MHYPSIERFSFGSSLEAALNDSSPEAEDNHKWYIQEKMDGSNLSVSFKRDGDNIKLPKELTFACGRNVIDPDREMFKKTCDRLILLIDNLNPNFVYHGEAIRKCKHNIAQYSRVPRHYFICFDIYDCSRLKYLSPDELIVECNRVGLEHVVFLHINNDLSIKPDVVMKDFISKIESGLLNSMLGGVPEGIVFKHHNFWYRGKYVASKRKLVTEKFKECQHSRQSKNNISADEFIEKLGKCFAVEGRFAKARQHLEELGKLNKTPGDKKRISHELDMDFDKEYKDEICTYLWQELGPVIKFYAKTGLDDWCASNLVLEESCEKK